jgi:hypothetical protein
MPTENNGNEDLSRCNTLRQIEFAISARFKMSQDWPESGHEHVNMLMADNRLAEIAKNGKSNMSRPPER